MFGIAFDSIDKIGNEVVAALQDVFDLSFCGINLGLFGGQGTLTANRNESADKKNDEHAENESSAEEKKRKTALSFRG